MATAFRPCGDFYSTGQAEWRCDDCNADQFTCVCDEVELCTVCNSDITGGDLCPCDDALAAPPVVRAYSSLWL